MADIVPVCSTYNDTYPSFPTVHGDGPNGTGTTTWMSIQNGLTCLGAQPTTLWGQLLEAPIWPNPIPPSYGFPVPQPEIMSFVLPTGPS